jgi:hypothetical protein
MLTMSSFSKSVGCGRLMREARVRIEFEKMSAANARNAFIESLLGDRGPIELMEWGAKWIVRSWQPPTLSGITRVTRLRL